MGGHSNPEYNYAGTIAGEISEYTRNIGIEHESEYIGNTFSYFETLLKKNIDNGYPVMFNIVVSSVGEFFNYTTGGHYVTVIGYYYEQSQQRYMLVVNDPHYNDGIIYCKTRHVPLTYLYDCYVTGNAQHLVLVNGLSTLE